MTIIKYNQQYSLCQSSDGRTFHYSDGAVESVCLRWVQLSKKENYPEVKVTFRNGEVYNWDTIPKCVGGYLYQFGVSVSYDGRFVFCQTWDRGLYALDAKTGDIIWKTKSRRGVTNIFINADSVLCCQHEKALQLLDINNGEVFKELKTTAWGFESIDKAHIVCRIRANEWCLIESTTLDIVETFSNREFTDGHTDYVVQTIDIVDGKIHVCGFKNVWDNSTKPATMLPNLTFENIIETKTKLKS